MDNLCHTLVGAALGEAGLKRRTGLAMPTLMIAANLPDLDVVAIPLGESLPFRRGWTHGPLAWVVLPLLLTAAMLGWQRLRARRGRVPAQPVRPGQLLLLSVLGVLSHPLFDWLNTYGVRALMPFSERWFYGDAVFIVDPWIWLVLGAGVLLSRRLDARRGGRPVSRPALVALAAVGLYAAAMVATSVAAERIARAEFERRTGQRVVRLMAGPAPLTPLRRELVFDLGHAYGFGELRWTPRPRVRLERGIRPKQLDHPAVAVARRAESVRDFLYWSRFPYFRVVDGEGGAWVVVADARYASVASDGWAVAQVWVPGARRDAAGAGRTP